MDERPNQNDGPNIDPNIANPPYIGTERAQRRASGRGGDGEDGGSGMVTMRVAHLETRMDRIEGKIDLMADRLGAIATRTETRNYLWLAIATFVAIVGLLIAAMGWLETRASRLDTGSTQPLPIVIQLPPTVTAPEVMRPTPPRPSARRFPG